MCQKNKSDLTRAENSRKARRAALMALLASLLAACPSCKSLNESPNNTRYWFPTLAPPTKAEQDMRRYNYPEGGDPFVDANVGPRSFNTRPRGWEDQRSKTSDVVGQYPDVVYEE